MEKIDSNELWRQIPPEEKFDLIARAQAKGIMVSVMTVIIACTVAVGLKQGWLIWASLILTPLLFQFAAGREWRGLKPRVMLEYLAARAAARRYAFTARAKDLHLTLMFRGKIERIFDDEEGKLKELEAAIENSKECAVWIALFNDAVIMMSERFGGAQLEFAHVINDKLEISGQSPGNKGEYASDREILLSFSDRRSGGQKVKVTSRYSAALVVFEKKLLQLQKDITSRESTVAMPAPAEILSGAEHSYNDY